jgi:hypothetical protein
MEKNKEGLSYRVDFEKKETTMFWEVENLCEDEITKESCPGGVAIKMKFTGDGSDINFEKLQQNVINVVLNKFPNFPVIEGHFGKCITWEYYCHQGYDEE